MTKIRIIIWAALFFASIALGGTCVWMIQETRIGRMQVDIARLLQEREACVKANADNVATITKLTAALKKVEKLSGARLQEKERLIRRLQNIDAIKVPPKPMQGEKNENATDHDGSVADCLLDELNRLFPGKADRPN